MKGTNVKYKAIGISVTEEQELAVKKASFKLHKNVSLIFREALDAYLEKHKDELQ